MSYTRAQWIVSCFQRAGQPAPSEELIQWGVAWTLFETGDPHQGAAYNLLNTTQQEPGSTFFNHLPGGIGVQNFVSYDQGTDANAAVLKLNYYTQIHQAIEENNVELLKTGEAINQELSIWGTGPRQAQITAAMGQGLTELCPGIRPSDPGEPPTTPPDTYTVESGDTLSGIGARFGVAVSTLLTLNLPMLDVVARQHGYHDSQSGRWIFPGETLKVIGSAPPRQRKTYEVQGGDTLSSIADQVGEPAATLYAWNQSILDQSARAHGFASSENGHWIFPGEILEV